MSQQCHHESWPENTVSSRSWVYQYFIFKMFYHFMRLKFTKRSITSRVIFYNGRCWRLDLPVLPFLWYQQSPPFSCAFGQKWLKYLNIIDKNAGECTSLLKFRALYCTYIFLTFFLMIHSSWEQPCGAFHWRSLNWFLLWQNLQILLQTAWNVWWGGITHWIVYLCHSCA